MCLHHVPLTFAYFGYFADATRSWHRLSVAHNGRPNGHNVRDPWDSLNSLLPPNLDLIYRCHASFEASRLFPHSNIEYTHRLQKKADKVASSTLLWTRTVSFDVISCRITITVKDTRDVRECKKFNTINNTKSNILASKCKCKCTYILYTCWTCKRL